MVENWDTVGELERTGNWPWDVCASAPTGMLIRHLWVVWDNWQDDASHTLHTMLKAQNWQIVHILVMKQLRERTK